MASDSNGRDAPNSNIQLVRGLIHGRAAAYDTTGYNLMSFNIFILSVEHQSCEVMSK